MQTNLINVTMKNGLILGLLFTLNFFLSASGIAVLGLFIYIVMALIIYLTYKYTVNYRDVQREGVISFGQAGLFVLLLFFFASLISALVKYIYVKFINTEFLTSISNQTMQVVEQIMPTVPENFYDMVDEILRPINYTMLTMSQNFIWGILLAIIIGLIVKRNINPFQNNQTNFSNEEQA